VQRYTLVLDAVHAAERREWADTLRALVGGASGCYERLLFTNAVETVLLVGDVWHPMPTPFVLLARQCSWLVAGVVAQPHVFLTPRAASQGLSLGAPPPSPPPSTVGAFLRGATDARLVCTAAVAALRVWVGDALNEGPRGGDDARSPPFGGHAQLFLSDVPERDAAQWITDARQASADGPRGETLVVCTSRAMRRRVMDAVHAVRGDAGDHVWCEGMLARDRDTGVVWRLRALYDRLRRRSVTQFSSSQAAADACVTYVDADGAVRAFDGDAVENAECLCVATGGEPLELALTPALDVRLLVDETTTLRDVAFAARYATRSVWLVVPDVRTAARIARPSGGDGCLPETNLEWRLDAVLRRALIDRP
jgi:hypothetical protein